MAEKLMLVKGMTWNPGHTQERPSDEWAVVLLPIAVICCAVPLLLVAVATTGAAAWLAVSGLLIASVFVLAAALVALTLWLRRRRSLTR